eukprot:GEMP01072490.1.p1 GENE.GEMP01072490.1~~GEMP01072490.1.p1  ORF type:complete len:126 (-),score=2.13 GEMP01072490.1:153-530(-)
MPCYRQAGPQYIGEWGDQPNKLGLGGCPKPNILGPTLLIQSGPKKKPEVPRLKKKTLDWGGAYFWYKSDFILHCTLVIARKLRSSARTPPDSKKRKNDSNMLICTFFGRKILAYPFTHSQRYVIF